MCLALSKYIVGKGEEEVVTLANDPTHVNELFPTNIIMQEMLWLITNFVI
jgi:hypothetical protein